MINLLLKVSQKYEKFSEISKLMNWLNIHMYEIEFEMDENPQGPPWLTLINYNSQVALLP